MRARRPGGGRRAKQADRRPGVRTAGTGPGPGHRRPGKPPPTAGHGPLHGVRVLDLSWALAGPFATMILADLGAEVIKVELPGRGDLARHNGPFLDGLSTYFLSINRNKKGITLNLKAAEGRALLLELARRSDILVENFRPGTMKRLGLDYAAVAAVNPAIVYASCAGFGQTGPYAEKGAFDIIIQGMGGAMSLTGEPGRPPVRVGFSVADLGAGLYTVIGILAALRERMVSGAGQYLDVSMLDTQIALMENAYTRYLATGEVPQPMGSRHPVITPFQAFPSRDGYLVLAIGTDEQWRSFVRHVGRPELGEDPRFSTVPARTAHHDALEAILSEITRTKTTAEWLATLEPIGIPCGPINTIPRVVADPHVQARGMFAEVEHRGVGCVRVVAPPLKFSRTPAAVRHSCPELGEHTEEVLRDLLGLPPSEVARLRREGVI